ncbi:peptidylprolyl isomerase [Paenibacillus chitinolyticus]|uniref:peptidylprolyl isomerase n=1 Tax=Paenibacillus chitinolyticus TaxID=79263 RepID=UPI002DB5D5A7|nr:peptidylprolyl isomerase [Paenibacillus chitinolyticus]MEC0247942.1 peptidylprolyl isomerase [Paenibacillus chitinolyticus]
MTGKRKGFTGLLLLVMALLVIAAGCGKAKTDSSGTATPAPTPSPTAAGSAGGSEPPKTDGKNPVVTIEMDNGKIIKAELYPQVAPNTVNNFISLIKKGFYDGKIFHRVIPGFMIQGGDPDGTGAGGPGYGIKGEFTSNGFKNELKHTRGVLSMARAQDPDSAGSQFFIMVADSPHLDGQYASFGKVTEGMEAVDEIVNQPTEANDRPKTPPAMKKVTVDTLGVDYPEPKTIK